MAVTIRWLGHASFRIGGGSEVVYIDPWKLAGAPHDATAVLVSHSHYDHYSAQDISQVATASKKIIGPSDVVSKEKNGQTLQPGQTIEVGGTSISGVASYNPVKQFHPRANKWLGFIVEIDSVRIYYAGDTELIDEMRQLSNIGAALLPVGGTYTMDAGQAIAAVDAIKPKRAIPCHWGDIVGNRGDAERFVENATCEVTVLAPGESVEVGG